MRVFSMFIMLGIILLLVSCKNPNSLKGNWRCDLSGEAIMSLANERDTTITIREFYKLFEIPPFHFEFLASDTMIMKNSKHTYRSNGNMTFTFSDKKYSILKYEEGSSKRFLLLTNEGRDESTLDYEFITNDVIKLELTQSDISINLIMHRIQ